MKNLLSSILMVAFISACLSACLGSGSGGTNDAAAPPPANFDAADWKYSLSMSDNVMPSPSASPTASPKATAIGNGTTTTSTSVCVRNNAGLVVGAYQASTGSTDTFQLTLPSYLVTQRNYTITGSAAAASGNRVSFERGIVYSGTIGNAAGAATLQSSSVPSGFSASPSCSVSVVRTNAASVNPNFSDVTRLRITLNCTGLVRRDYVNAAAVSIAPAPGYGTLDATINCTENGS